MKKIQIILFAAMLVSVFDASAFGDDDDDRRRRRRKSKGPSYEVGINPFGYLFGNYNVIGAAHMSENSSIFVEIAYARSKADYFVYDPITLEPIPSEVVFSGFSFAPEYRHYFNPDEGNDGWFIGGYLNIRAISTSGKPYIGFNSDDEIVNYDLNTFGLAPGATLGRGWAFDSGITLTLWGGFGYSVVYSEKQDPVYVPSNDPAYSIYETAVGVLNKVDIRGGFTVGYRL